MDFQKLFDTDIRDERIVCYHGTSTERILRIASLGQFPGRTYFHIVMERFQRYVQLGERYLRGENFSVDDGIDCSRDYAAGWEFFDSPIIKKPPAKAPLLKICEGFPSNIIDDGVADPEIITELIESCSNLTVGEIAECVERKGVVIGLDHSPFENRCRNEFEFNGVDIGFPADLSTGQRVPTSSIISLYSDNLQTRNELIQRSKAGDVGTILYLNKSTQN